MGPTSSDPSSFVVLRGTVERLCSYGRMFLTPDGRRERRFDSIHGVRTSGRLALYELGSNHRTYSIPLNTGRHPYESFSVS